MQLELREYQTETIQAVNGAWSRGENRPAVVLPTGSGKTVIFAHMIKDLQRQGIRAVTLVHRDELVNQAVEKLHGSMPDARIGIVKAEHNQVDADAIVASVQTLARENRRNQLTGVGALIVDEAHHARAPTYQRILEHYGSFNGLPTAGFTATLVRGDGKGLGTIWPEVVYERNIEWMAERGYLVWPKGKAVKVDDLSLDEVARYRGDYQDGDLGKALMSVGAGEHIAKAWLEHAPDRPGAVFAPTVESAYGFAEDLNAAGLITEVIIGTTPLDKRKEIYQRVYEGKTQILSNCMVLTEGFDMPKLSCLVPRPTSNPGLYTQMVGRGLRPWPGKEDCLVLDLYGNASKHKLVTLKDLSRYQARDNETLKEAKERYEKERGEKGQASGVQTAEDIDLFGKSRSAWLQTYAGIYFIPTRQHVYFLWPTTAGNFWVGKCWNRTTRDGMWLAKDVTLDYGMAWAEQEAGREDPSVSQRTASWRVKRQPPSQAQVDVASRIRGLAYQGKSKAELSDMLSVHFASRLLDRR